jgi:hypothetical protein
VKRQLTTLLEGSQHVSEAYLARIGYQPRDATAVALCLRSDQPGDRAIILGVAAVARRVLSVENHLDIVFVDDGQLIDLQRVCRPFFQRAT